MELLNWDIVELCKYILCTSFMQVLSGSFRTLLWSSSAWGWGHISNTQNNI